MGGLQIFGGAVEGMTFAKSLDSSVRVMNYTTLKSLESITNVPKKQLGESLALPSRCPLLP